MTDFLLRPALPGDAPALAALAARAFRDTFASNYSKEDLQAFLDSAYAVPKIRRELEDPAYHCFVAERPQALVGYALLQNGAVEPGIDGPDPIELQRIYVLQETLGSGLGQALLEACVAKANALGRRTLWLGVWEHNPRAQAFYRRNGFVEVGAHTFKVGSVEDRDLLFQKSLP